MKTLIGNTLASLKENFSRVFNFIYCALIVLGVYFVFMFTLNLVAHDLFVTDKNGDNFFSFLGEYSWWIIYAVAYGIPLYYIHFKKDGELKTFVLHETENGYDKKALIKSFAEKYFLTDMILYALYSALLLLPFKDVFDNPAGYISMHQLIFYMLNIPRIVSYLLALIAFVLQYFACFLFAERYFIKNKIRKQ